MSWDDARIELLTKLWNDGRTASQIAGDMGGGITRNAVIGKAHRLGLSGRARPAANPASSASARGRDKTTSSGNAPSKMKTGSARGGASGGVAMSQGGLALDMSAHPEAVLEMNVQPEAVVLPMVRRIDIMALRDGVCRWPLGDPRERDTFAYCGAECSSAHVYCTGHSRLAYQQVPFERRR